MYQTKLTGDEISRFMWGSPQAKTISLSFWIKSNVTGIFVFIFAIMVFLEEGY